jgi:polyphosphate kinase
MAQYELYNRDLSWLSFNHRVLEEAYDESLPLYERIRFLAIYSSNLEEFYRVRVSYYRDLMKNVAADDPKLIQVKPHQILHEINRIVGIHQREFHQLFYDVLMPQLQKHGIILVEQNEKLSAEQERHIHKLFQHHILTTIQPVLLIRDRIKPFMKTGHLYLALKLYTRKPGIKNIARLSRSQYALVKVPTDHNISRFAELPMKDGKHYIMFLEDIMVKYLNEIFPGYVISGTHSIKVTRDADLEYEDYDSEELKEVIENLETTRAIGLPNRFQYDARMDRNMMSFLEDALDIDRDTLVKGGRTHNFRDFFNFPNPLSPDLEHPKHIPLPVPELESDAYFDKFEKKEYMLHFPYQSFDYFINFLKEAAKDPAVIEINTTQYRVATKSEVVETLIQAASNGKKVTVFVELKARFDEEANLRYAREMAKAGINIVYSLPGLKVHAKLALVRRRGKKAIAFLGTGNFNEKTARLYCDHGFFTSDTRIIDDLLQLFHHLVHRTPCNFQHILVPNFNLVETFINLINREINIAREGGQGFIIIKLNGLEDQVMIHKLYEASEAGVRIELLVRGVCSLMPEMEYSRNIRVVRIIDRFLEHARVFYFRGGGDEKLFMGSADWMRRNLVRRIECVFPVYNPEIKAEVLDILNIQINANVNARIIDKDHTNKKIDVGDKPLIRAQQAIYEYLKKKYTPATN